MPPPPLRIVVLGLSLSSSWGNGHATTWRALLKALAARGHQILFLEREVPWYAAHRDLAAPDFCTLAFYADLPGLAGWRTAIADADAVIVGSYVPQGVAVGALVQAWAGGTTAFYDIDTPVTLAKLEQGDEEYLAAGQVPGYHLYLSFTGGPTLEGLMRRYGAPDARVLYCSVDADEYRPRALPPRWDLSYLGTYSPDRQPKLDRLLVEAARRAPALRFAVAGPLYPGGLDWPPNVERLEHVAPGDHPAFYAMSRFTLNITRADMARAGFSPSVRLFEAGACGTPVLSDAWPGLETLFAPGRDITVVADADDVLGALSGVTEADRRALGAALRERVLARHTAAHRAAELEGYLRARPVATKSEVERQPEVTRS